MFVHGGTGVVGFSTFGSNGINDFFGSTPIDDNEWHHIALVYTADGNKKRIYVDGVLDAETNNPHTGGVGSGNEVWGILGDGSEATSFNGPRNNEYFVGEMDEIRVWNYARTGVEIQEYRDEKLLGCEYGLELYYQFDDASGSNIPDLTGNYDATADGEYEYGVGAPAYVEECPTESFLDFNAGNGFIALDKSYSDAGDEPNPELAELTVEAWVNTTDYDPNATGDAYQNNWAILDFDRNEYFSVYVNYVTGTVGFSTTGPGGQPHDYFGNIFVADGDWHHIAVVYNGTHKFIYVDGVLDISTVGATTAPHDGDGLGRENAVTSLRYGYIGDGSESESFNGTNEIQQPARNNKYYTGKLDEVRLWHTTRTQNEINDNRFVRLTGCEEDLILYYDFNEGGGTEIYDKARHTYSLFNGGIDWETGNGPIEDCASPTPDGNPLVVGLNGYRYGFNGMEKDDEVKGSGNSLNYKARVQDTRLGRFLSIDPLTSKFPYYSPYQFAGNKPIWAIDLDGKEEYFRTKFFSDGDHYKTEITVVSGAGSEQFKAIVHDSEVRVNTGIGTIDVVYIGADRGSHDEMFSTSELGRVQWGPKRRVSDNKNIRFGAVGSSGNSSFVYWETPGSDINEEENLEFVKKGDGEIKRGPNTVVLNVMENKDAPNLLTGINAVPKDPDARNQKGLGGGTGDLKNVGAPPALGKMHDYEFKPFEENDPATIKTTSPKD